MTIVSALCVQSGINIPSTIYSHYQLYKCFIYEVNLNVLASLVIQNCLEIGLCLQLSISKNKWRGRVVVVDFL